ncbi:hypothetical protein F4679DRAFT_599431 [Xylaria curta]|nr:hypothetical protein F4679DRAFT_599431 [Xylaria curta]
MGQTPSKTSPDTDEDITDEDFTDEYSTDEDSIDEDIRSIFYFTGEDDTDQDVRLLFDFAAETYRYGYGTVKIQACTRKWYNFLEHRIPGHSNITLRPGALERLPPEIRFMIYDLLMPPRENHFDCSKIYNKVPVFGFPTIAHVCREMRQYAMQKYRFVRIMAFVKGYRWEKDRFGVFDPAQDSITIDLPNCWSIEWLQDATIQWNDPFQRPRLASSFVIRSQKYEIGERPIRFDLGAECEVWQRDWVGDRLGPRILL